MDEEKEGGGEWVGEEWCEVAHRRHTLAACTFHFTSFARLLITSDRG